MATGAPGTNGVWQYGEDDSEATFSALLNKAAATTDTQIGADRARLDTLEARKLSGLVPIIPTSVSINAGSSSHNSTTGEITFTGGSVLTINGVFSSSYNYYKVIWDIESSSAGADIYMQFKNAGGTLATAYYNYSAAVNTSSAFGGNYSANQTTANVGRTNGTQGSFLSVDIINPGNTRIKRWTSQTVDQLLMRTSNGYNFTATAYTDLIIYPNGQNSTNGKCKVYGYN